MFRTLSDQSALHGVIDDVRIYNRALSESEIQELYQGSGAVLPSNYTPVQENHSKIDQGEHHWWDFINDKLQNLIVRLGFGSIFNIKMYKPDGTLYSEQQSSTSPIEVLIPNADPGQWRFEITAVETPIPADPYLLTIGTEKPDSGWQLADIICALRVLSGVECDNSSLPVDVDGDGKIGMEEVLYRMQEVSQLR